MPELPEVETIKNNLSELIIGKRILSVVVNLDKQVQGSTTRFQREVKGAKVKALERRAKMLVIELEGDKRLVFHLKMTGQLIYSNKNLVAGGGHSIEHDLRELPNKYSHVIFNFSDGGTLFFNDLRQFGWVKLVNKKELEKMLEPIGPEPLEINFREFKKLFEGKKSVVKLLLMDPSFIAGVGNIYAAESLFCAGISPDRKVDSLSESELKKIYNCLRRILKLAIEKKGTTASDYVDAFGRKGLMEKYLKVYKRNGLPCKKCGNKLELIKQGQRSTVYCKKCQK